MEKSIDIELEKFPAEKLVDELNCRHHYRDFKPSIARLDFDDMIDLFAHANCPVDLIARLRSWNDSPIPDKIALEQWLNP